MPLLCCLGVPIRRFDVILLHPFTPLVTNSKVVLGINMTLLCRFRKPLKRNIIILLHAFALVVIKSNTVLGISMAHFGGLAKEFGGFLCIVSYCVSFIKQYFCLIINILGRF